MHYWRTLTTLMSLLGAMAFSAQRAPAQEATISQAFLFSESTWMGEFQNFVNRGEGITQSGRIMVEMTLSGDTIRMRNIFLNQQGEPTDYTGYASMMVQGNDLISLDTTDVDQNTGNPLERKLWVGKILDRHIYIHEAYHELKPDGSVEPRSNSVHYFLDEESQVIQLAEVWVNGQLLVVASTRLIRMQD